MTEPHALMQRTLDGWHRFMMPRWNFPPVSATGHLGGIDRVKVDESCKMIEFEVMYGPLKALAAQTEDAGNRIGPELTMLKQEAGATALFFGLSYTLLALPRACARGVVVARTGRL